MNNIHFVKAGGTAMIISGLALGYSYVSHPHHMPPDVIASPSWVVIHALFALSLILGLLATTALYSVTANRTGKLGLIGYLLLFVGMMLIFGLDYYEILIAPYLAVHYPAVIVDHGPGDTMGYIAVMFPLSGLLTVSGYTLLGIAWKRYQVIPNPVALGLVITSIAFGIGLSPIGGLTIARMTAAGFGLALVATGICALRKDQQFTRFSE